MGKEREVLMCERNINLLPLTAPQVGTGPPAQACALTRSQTGNLLKLEKTPTFGLPVTTKPNRQWQRLNLSGCCIQMVGNLRRWWVHT